MTAAMPPAVRWGRALERALKRCGMSQAALAREALLSEDTIRKWRHGRVLPSIESAALVAEVLTDDRLTRLAAEAREHTCRDCGRAFVLARNTGPRYGGWCSMRCRQRDYERRVRAAGRGERKERIGRELALYRNALENYCDECEPSGVCRTPECTWRSLSTHPLVRERAA